MSEKEHRFKENLSTSAWWYIGDSSDDRRIVSSMQFNTSTELKSTWSTEKIFASTGRAFQKDNFNNPTAAGHCRCWHHRQCPTAVGLLKLSLRTGAATMNRTWFPLGSRYTRYLNCKSVTRLAQVYTHNIYFTALTPLSFKLKLISSFP